MKPSHPWHSTPVGVAVRWLGSIQLAVPVLTLVSVAMAWGTYLESTQDAKVARATVYGSWWFLALMVLVCISLIFAGITRYPWKRRHVGFLMVHASLIALIAGGFWSLYGRIEGRLLIEQGKADSVIEMTDEQLEIVEHDAGTFRVVEAMPAPVRPGSYTLAGLNFEVVECWNNVAEAFEITDTGTEPYRAVQIAFGPNAASAVWIGDEARGEAPVIDGIRIRVLGAGVAWEGDAAPGQTPGGYVFVLGDKKLPLVAEGQDAFDGWKVTSIKRFSHATVSAGALSEEKGKAENPAVDVEITDGKGTVERHTAFDLFPDMPLSKTLQGEARSGARLVAVGTPGVRRGEETLVIWGDPPAIKLAHISGAGAVSRLEYAGEFPYLADFGVRKLSILKQFSHTVEKSTFTKGAPAKDRRPALVIKLNGETSPLAWKAMQPVSLAGRAGLLRYGPRSVQLPFTVKLEEFRKTDYPGTEMAMAYESEVTVNAPNTAEQRTTISMNAPLVHSGWKVYQSGFLGQNISIFSVMRDPGLPLTYLSCITLCIGIMVTFYGRGLSWGHPGIPVPFAVKEQSNAPSSLSVDSVVVDSDVDGDRRTDARVGEPVGSPADPGRRESDAAGYVRA